MRKKSSSVGMQKLEDILPKILKNQNVFLGQEEKRLRLHWIGVVGHVVAAQTSPEKITGNILHVNVSTTVWKHQLLYLKNEILEKWNRRPGYSPLTDIRFSIGSVSSLGKPGHLAVPIHVETSRLHDQDKKFIENSLRSVSDPELKDGLKNLMIREISRRRRLQLRRDG
jgi:predicted nucleic acid-binding Zn ribbon protein